MIEAVYLSRRPDFRRRTLATITAYYHVRKRSSSAPGRAVLRIHTWTRQSPPKMCCSLYEIQQCRP